MKRSYLFLALIMLLAFVIPAFAEPTESVPAFTEPLDYSEKANWAYYREGGDRQADLFIVCPI